MGATEFSYLSIFGATIAVKTTIFIKHLHGCNTILAHRLSQRLHDGNIFAIMNVDQLLLGNGMGKIEVIAVQCQHSSGGIRLSERGKATDLLIESNLSFGVQIWRATYKCPFDAGQLIYALEPFSAYFYPFSFCMNLCRKLATSKESAKLPLVFG